MCNLNVQMRLSISIRERFLGFFGYARYQFATTRLIRTGEVNGNKKKKKVKSKIVNRFKPARGGADDCLKQVNTDDGDKHGCFMTPLSPLEGLRGKICAEEEESVLSTIGSIFLLLYHTRRVSANIFLHYPLIYIFAIFSSILSFGRQFLNEQRDYSF